jgi:uncharacterized pyridoxamine 5'-phosphate oxidase family protein
MDGKKEFDRIMNEVDTIALASSVNDVPNVRFVNFVYLAEENKFYFQTGKKSQKREEFEKNKNVALITMETSNGAHVRIQKATVKLSEKTIYDVQEEFVKKMSFYKNLIQREGDDMDLYEIQYTTVIVHPNVNTLLEIKF